MLKYRTVLGRSLRYFWRAHLGVVLGSAVGAAALVGALVVGDSVRESLRARAEARLGRVDLALHGGDRLFTRYLAEAELLDGLGATAPGLPRIAPAGRGLSAWVGMLNVRGTAVRQDGTARAHEVQIFGAVPELWPLAPGAGGGEGEGEVRATPIPAPGEVWINQALAEQLGTERGESIILRFAKPSALSQDAVMTSRNDAAAALRLKVAEVLDAGRFGELSLRSSQRPALNAFVNPEELGRVTGETNRINLILATAPSLAGPIPRWRRWVVDQAFHWRNQLPDRVFGGIVDRLGPSRRMDAAASDAALQWVTALLRHRWTLADGELEVRTVESGAAPDRMVEVVTRRVFLDPVVAAKAAALPEPEGGSVRGLPVLTYLANALKAGDRLAPYSMVCGAGAPWTPEDLAEDEMVITDWLAADLGIKAGDRIEMTWYDAEAGARLLERTNSFRVRSVVAVEGRYADRSLMPEFPGLAKAESTRDWDAGFPLVHKIRAQDEDYWKQHRGTPKAFVHPEAARRMWGNRFGNATAVRIPVPEGHGPTTWRHEVEKRLRAELRPSDAGLAFRAVRQEAFAAATSGQDFGQLFIGFSFFLVFAALLLTGLLFQFGLEQRLPEVGTWLALGFPPRTVRRHWLIEGAVLAGIGGGLGVAGGYYYAQGLVWGLTSLWRDAVASTPLEFHATAGSVVAGYLASVLVAVGTLALGLRRRFARPVRELLAGEIGGPRVGGRGRGWRVAMVAGGLGLGLVAWALARGEAANPGIFFGVGTLALVAGLGAFAAALGRWSGIRGKAGAGLGDLTTLAVRGTARRRGRSLATVGLLASGTFLVTAIGAFRMDAQHDAGRRESGTGGFALIGESSLAIPQDLNSGPGREAYGLGSNELAGVQFVPFRVREGDEASCLNLDRAQRPRLLGVRTEGLEQRGAFTFQSVWPQAPGGTATKSAGWGILRAATGAPVDAGGTGGIPEIPAVGDAASIQWALGSKVGGTLEMTDERGNPFRLRLVGGVANSVLQGSLVIDEAAFTRLFPGESGYRFFLVDAPSNRVAEVAGLLTRALTDAGAEWTPAVRRLNQFNAVQNTYLSTFQVLGGLGLLLGGAGLGVVVLRNVLERRSEFAALSAMGFRRDQLARLVLGEHLVLLATGLGVGVLGAAIALIPSWSGGTSGLPPASLGWTLVGVGILGLATAWWAVRHSLRGPLLAALRAE